MASKHFFAGSQRIATKMVKKEQNGSSGNIVLEKEQYYYHPDHLGSSSFVTDEKGKVYEHLEYFPFGETFAHEHSNTQVTPYRFTGKELDEVTGLYYYGARYYDPRTSVWQSPDPILGEYMSGQTNGGVYNPKNLSLFTYTYNNPVNLVDPDGNAPMFKWSKSEIGAGRGGIVPGTRTFVDKSGNISPSKSFQPRGPKVTISSNLKTKKMEIEVGEKTYIEGPKATKRAGANEFKNVPKRDQEAIVNDFTGGVKPITPKKGVEVYDKPDGTRTTVRTESTSNPGNINIDVKPKGGGKKIEIKFKD